MKIQLLQQVTMAIALGTGLLLPLPSISLALGDSLPIRIAQQSPAPRRIQFRAGASSGTVSGSVVRGTRDTYLVNAGKGQKMSVSITSPEQNAVFDVIDPKGKLLKQEKTRDTLTLPLTGDYKIVVGGTRGNASYTLTVAIK